MSVFVIGHKNPDTDAICSAIAYAWFLRETSQPDAVAACCGEINARTQFVLNRAGLESPRLLMDVRPTLGQISRGDVVSVQDDDPVLEVYQRMRDHGFQTMVVRDRAGKFIGLIPLVRLMELLVPDGRSLSDTRMVETSLARIARVLHARFLHEKEAQREETLTLMVAAMSEASFGERMRSYSPEHLVIAVGDRPSVQKAAIEYGVRAIVVTGGHTIAPDMIAAARQRGVTLLGSPLDTASTTLLIRGAKVIHHAIQQDYLSFRRNQLVEEATRSLRDTPQNLFPVLDEQGELAGVFTKSDLINLKPIRLILVDHNEFSQAVTGVEQAEILEVIDHHRLGGSLISREPIRFVNEPLGSTCTIISKFLHHRGWVPPKPIATCLVAGIVSDTLHLTSPTATPTDKAMLEWLCAGAGIDAKQFADEFFAAGSALQTQAPEMALRADLKEYEEKGWRFAVAQIEEIGLELFWKSKDGLLQALDRMVKEQGLDFACLLITDITRNTSYLLTSGSEELEAAIDYPKEDLHLFELEGIVSRKKQLLPHLIRILTKLGR